MIELIVNGVRLDVSEDINIPLNYSQADAKMPEKRKRNYSKDIVLPGTKVNNTFFQSAYNLNISDVYGDLVGFEFDPTLRYPAIILRNGKLIFRGDCNLRKVVTKSDTTNGRINEFYINIYSEINGLFQSFQDLKVSDLDWSDYDFVLSVANIQATWTAAVGSGVWVPYIQYGYSQDPLKIQTNQLFPFVYVKEIVEKAFALGGFTVTGNFFGSALLKKLTWGSGGGVIISIGVSDKANRLVDATGVGSASLTASPSGIETIGMIPKYTTFNVSYVYPFRTDSFITVTEVSDILNQFNPSLSVLTVANTGTYLLDYSQNLTIDWATSSPSIFEKIFIITVTVIVRVNGAPIGTTVHNISSSADGSDTFNMSILQPLSLNSGDKVRVSTQIDLTGSKLRIDPLIPLNGIDIDTTFNSINYTFSATDSAIVDGDTVNISRFLPDMKLSDFMNDLITMFNLYMSDPDENNEIIMLSEGGYFLDTDDTDNWSNKLDRGSDIEIESASQIEGKTYRFKWAQDRDYYKNLYFQTYGHDYGDYNYEVPSTFKKGDKIYQLNSAQSVPVQIESTDIIIPHIFQKEEATGVVKPHKGKPRFFFNNGTKTTVNGWKLVNSDTGAETVNFNYPVAHHLDNLTTSTFDLNFGVPTIVYYNATTYTYNNLFLSYHSQFIRQLTGRDSKIVNAWFKLNESDFYTNFMRRLVNIDGVVYRKNQIKDWLANGSNVVKVELLKILEGDSFNVQDLPSLPIGYEPATTSTGGGVILTSNVTARSNQTFYPVDTTSGNVNIQLTSRTDDDPYAGAPYGTTYTIKMVAGANRVRIFPPQGGGTIDGAAMLQLTTINQSVTLLLVDNAGNYKII